MKKKSKSLKVKNPPKKVVYRVTVNAQISVNYLRVTGHTCQLEDLLVEDIKRLKEYARDVLALDIWFDDEYFDIERDGIPTYAHPQEKKNKCN